VRPEKALEMKRRKKMKIDISKRAVSAALALVFVAAAIPSANAQQTDLRKYVVGTWRQPVRTMIGTTDVHVLTLRADGSYIHKIYVNGNTTDPAWHAGNWEIRNGNELWFHILGAYPTWTYGVSKGRIMDAPDNTNKPDPGYHYHRQEYKPIHSDEEMFPVQIVDANHSRNPGGIATRIGY
jgi:hypothetical protein